MLYYGTVTRVAGTKIWVKVPELGKSKEFGPLKCIQAKQPTINNNTAPTATNSGGSPAHTHGITAHNHTVTNTHYNKGDTVVVGQVGAITESLVVLGRL